MLCQSVSHAFKRHLESRDQEPSSKHFLSEEKMAARFNSLSLDNDHIYSSNGFPVHSENPRWQQAYTQLKELQRRLSQDGASEETNSTEEELTTVIVDGEFMMGDCPMLVPSSFSLGLEGSSIAPEEMFLSLNPCTEVVLWSSHISGGKPE
ncbi:host cell factor C1 regulator 1 isoform X3 [Ahaetulla prasina]|uniref:host cell factor C1 regulator 1 isoform X3 n=1 Tax=Ahaetulla prasina TaxID=499056 RepID=UPI0026493AD7|nr:host cell factor C1 regulator 1 isoform X3 [Ahaetulla prasina]